MPYQLTQNGKAIEQDEDGQFYVMPSNGNLSILHVDDVAEEVQDNCDLCVYGRAIFGCACCNLCVFGRAISTCVVCEKSVDKNIQVTVINHKSTQSGIKQ